MPIRLYIKTILIVLPLFIAMPDNLRGNGSHSDIIKIEIAHVNQMKVAETGISCVVTINIKNNSNKLIYLPNPSESYTSGLIRYFIITPDKKVIDNDQYSITPLIGPNSWIKIEGLQTISFSKDIIIYKDDEPAENSDTEEYSLNKVRFEVRNKPFGNYILFSKIIFSDTFHSWKLEWLKKYQKTFNPNELPIWHGEAESNHLLLEK